jgi:hypothetical protein
MFLLQDQKSLDLKIISAYPDLIAMISISYKIVLFLKFKPDILSNSDKQSRAHLTKHVIED